MNIAQALTAAATDVVRIPLATNLTLHVRVRQVRSAELLTTGHAVIFAATPTRPAEPENELDAAIERELQRGQKPTPAQAAEVLSFADRVVCSCVEAASQDGASWEPFRVVAKQADANPEAGVMWIRNLPPGADIALYTAIMKLSTAGGAAGERLASFLRGAAPFP